MAIGSADTVVPGEAETYVPPKLRIALDHVLRIQGYRDMARVRADVRSIAIAMTAVAEELATPKAAFRTVPVEACDGDSLRLATGARFTGSAFGLVLGECREVVPFVLTLGEAIDTKVMALLESGEIVEALFLETAGWLGIEQATRALAGHLQRRAKADGLRLTRRLGPGHKEWELTEQRILFGLFSDTELPVRLLDSCAMLPKKSRSGLYGLKPLGPTP